MKKIQIDPITRLEGHGRIDIFINDKQEVENAYLVIPELRGFERFCEGRRAELMPQLTSRICGVCPVAHHMASAKALDMAFNVESPKTAHLIRELMYCGYIIYDHILHFYFLGGPDFVVGPQAPPEERNIFGVIKKAGVDIGKEVIKHRAYGQKITEIIGGKATHPVVALPGGVTKPMTEQNCKDIKEMLTSCVQFALKSLDLFNDIVIKNSDYVDLIKSDAFRLEVNDMGLVDSDGYLNFYDGKVRITDTKGKTKVEFTADEYLDVIQEKVVTYSYVKPTYIKDMGWRGFTEGPDSSLYRVGPLGRLNAASALRTPKAAKASDAYFAAFGNKPVHNTLAFHWARLIELLYASERGLELVDHPDIMGKDFRTLPNKPGEGMGVVEAARGTLFHHYKVNEEGLMDKVNLVVATTNNYAPIALSIKKAAQAVLKEQDLEDASTEGKLNMVEMAFRAYDPCFACASHSLGQKGYSVHIYDHKGKLRVKI